jgi:hypothetical protein
MACARSVAETLFRLPCGGSPTLYIYSVGRLYVPRLFDFVFSRKCRYEAAVPVRECRLKESQPFFLFFSPPSF